jgi:hypothetical protein
MVATHQPQIPETHQNTPIIPTGADIGAGLTKLVIGSDSQQMRLRLPSQVIENRTKLHDVLSFKDGGMFFYRGGSRPDLIDREFLIGTSAKAKDPKAHIKLSDDPALKVEYALHMMLGALSTLTYRPEWNLHSVISIHDKDAFDQALKANVEGQHIVSFNGQENPGSRINLKVDQVLPEGAGNYIYCCTAKPDPFIDRTGFAIGFDFGTSTVIPNVFSPGGKLAYRKVLDVGGCIDLLSSIASDQELINLLGQGKSGNIDLIRQGIEDRTFHYGQRQIKGESLTFKNIYSRHIKTWLADRLRMALKDVSPWMDEAQSLVAWGGGVEMPGVSQMLATKAITAVSEASWCGAVGLQKIAQSRLVRK